MFEFLLTLVFLITTILLSAVLAAFNKTKKPLKKIDKYFCLPESVEPASDALKQQHNLPMVIQDMAGKKLYDSSYISKIKRNIQILLDRADIPLTSGEGLLLSLIIMVGTFFISMVLTGNIIISFLLFGLNFFIIKCYLQIKFKNKINKINEQLADALEMIAGSIKTGYSFLRALEVASKEMSNPISKELSKIVKEVKIGLTIEQAFKNMMERIPIKDLELLVTAIVLQKQTGGNLVEIFDNIADTIRERISLKREVKTITSQGVLSGWIIALLPVFIVLTLMVLNPSYISALFTNTLGIFFLITAVFNEIAGVIIIRRIVNIEY